MSVTDRDRMELVRQHMGSYINDLIGLYEDLRSELDGVPRLLPSDRNWPMARRIENVRAIEEWREKTEDNAMVLLGSGVWVEREEAAAR